MATVGKGTTLGYQDVGASGSATPLSEVTDCNLPELNIANVDATHYTSPNNFVAKKSIIWRDVSDLPVKLLYAKAQTTTLYAIAGVEKDWTITLPDASTIKFPGFISKLGGDAIPNKDVIRQSATLTITGPVVFLAGT